MEDTTSKSYRERQRRSRIRRRLRVIEYYGGKCRCCGEKDYEFLCIDHIKGGGRKHRDIVGANVDRWIIKNKFPKGFRILCHNCNMSMGMYGYCPHKKLPEVLR